MKHRFNLGVSGIFKKVEVIKNGEVIRECTPFNNIILDTGLVNIGNNSNSFRHMVVGASNVEPLPTDNTLGSKFGGSAENPTSVYRQGAWGWNALENYISTTFVFTFGVGATTGNVSEIGVGPNSDGTNLTSKALVRDEMGNPTTVTVLSDEQLRVTYEARLYVDTTDVVQVFDGTTVTIRPANLGIPSDTSGGRHWNFYTVQPAGSSNAPPFNSLLVDSRSSSSAGLRLYTGSLGPMTGEPTGLFSNLSASTYITKTFSAANLEVSNKLVLPPSVGNDANGIGALLIASGGTVWQVGFSPNLPKDSLRRLEYELVFSWGRHTP